MALHSWPSSLLRRHVPNRAVPLPCLFVSRRASRRALARSGPAWDSSLGVVKNRPSIDISAWRPLPVGGLAPPGGSEKQPVGAVPASAQAPRGLARRGTRPSPSARRCHPPDSFRPCRSSRLRRFAPPSTLQVCCTLLPIMGFATFSDRRLCRCRAFRPSSTRAGLARLAVHTIGVPQRRRRRGS